MSEQATQQGRTIGLHISEHGYQFMIRQENALPMKINNVTQTTSKALDTLLIGITSHGSPIRVRNCAPQVNLMKISLALTLDGLQLQDEETVWDAQNHKWFDTENQLAAKTPQILLLPSGEITPFSLTLQEQGSDSPQFRQINGLEKWPNRRADNPNRPACRRTLLSCRGMTLLEVMVAMAILQSPALR